MSTDPPDAGGVTSDKELVMRVLVVGASGAIGTPLIRQLREQGHEVVGTSRSPSRADGLRALGAEPAVLDALDPAACQTVVAAAGADAIIYQATALASGGFTRKLDRGFAQTNRLRTEGTDNLLAAAQAAGIDRFIGQSFAPYRYERRGGPVKTEADRLDPAPPAAARQTTRAMQHLDEAVTGYGGIALRYGGFYGSASDGLIGPVRKRQLPIIGDGSGMMSFIHLDDAAAATVLALGHEGPAVYNITDDEPARSSEWMPVLAAALGAKPPRRAPLWLARLIAGGGVVMMTEARGADNSKAKQELGWNLRYPSWRDGFPAAYRDLRS
jgi:nucleoside-diphosphate-sugar epimerase